MNTRFRIHDAGFWCLDSGFRIQDAGFRIQDSGFKILVSGFWIQDAGCRILDSGFRSRIQDSGFWMQDANIGRSPWPIPGLSTFFARRSQNLNRNLYFTIDLRRLYVFVSSSLIFSKISTFIFFLDLCGCLMCSILCKVGY